MKALTLLFMAFLVLTTSGWAQNDRFIITGAIEHDQGNYLEAEATLRKGLADESKLKEKNRAKGWYYLGISLEKILTLPDEASNPKYQNALLESFEAYQRAMHLDVEGKFEGKILGGLERSYPLYLQASLAYLNARMPDMALSYANAAVFANEMVRNSEEYLPYDLRGQIHLERKDTVSGEKDFLKGISVFEQHPPTNPDLLVGYMYYRLAIIKRYSRKDMEGALDILSRGLAATTREFERMDERVKTGEQQELYKKVKADLSTFELDMLMRMPDKLELALQKFQQATQEDPNNYSLHLGYASLLESRDPAEAIEVYKKAIAIDPNKPFAHFNLGALYVNRGVVLRKQSNETDDYEESLALHEKAKAKYELAWPHFEKVHELNPNDLETLRALKEIAIYLEKMEDYKKYKELEERLRGN